MLIDLTHLIQNGLPVYPGDQETSLQQSKYIRQDYYNNHQLDINMHAGTHIDGPMHLLDIQRYLSEFPLEYFIGKACLLDVTGQEIIDYEEKYESLIEPQQIVVLYTGHSKFYGQEEYFTKYPILTKRFAEILVRKQVKMIGLDTPSPDKYPFEVHKLLFQHNILILENLTNVERLLNVSRFEIIALPMLIQADSAIARVVARIDEEART
ncbi:cyclase family protein [Paenibacillus lutimineralis]|uniref:Cyclase family protein n=1 Tax=Paenibacillus lutimineralis TaxID=2707005 RepID=A0A3S9UYE2_9BACL|nr:cyclase family protein [Paenibacillus lutimineralis]AZS15097.1 cyclase family protein [Paenibacillus lutimineralis]